MNLKKLLIVFCLFFTVQCVLGQSMTDDQVVQFIMTQQEKGESQQSIVLKLVQKGVTVLLPKGIRDFLFSGYSAKLLLGKIV